MDWESTQSRKRNFRIAAGTYSAVVCAAMIVYVIITLIISRGTWNIYSGWLALFLFAVIPFSVAGVIISAMVIANKIPKVFSCIILISSVQATIAGIVSLFTAGFIWAIIIILISGTNIALHITYLAIKEPERSNIIKDK